MRCLRDTNFLRRLRSLAGFQLAVITITVALGLPARAAATTPPPPVSTAAMDAQIRAFLQQQLTRHLDAIHSLNPPQKHVLGALTTGEFSWGTFMGALAYYSAETGKRQLAGRDLPRLIGQLGLIEARDGGKTWAQLAAARSLLEFNPNLAANPIWQDLSPAERTQWHALLNTDRFYDAKTQTVINLPANYYGVAARIAASDYKLGVFHDRAAVNTLLDRAAAQFTSGHIYSDDDLPTGRYDRYSNEYARDLFIAARLVGRTDLMQKLSPSLHQQMKLWWDVVSPDGYSYDWGRTIGDVSYMDTLEIVAFLGQNPQFRPAPMPELAAVYNAAWQWLRRDYSGKTHQLGVFAYGRGSYHYISRAREWQQTTQFFGKLAHAEMQLHAALLAEHIDRFPAQPSLPPVARFVFFRHGARPAGVWVVRQGRLRFALPIVTGPEAGIADYQPAPAGLPGMAPPVEQIYPCLTPFLTLANGQRLVAADAADAIQPAPDGRSLTVTWHNWVTPGGKAAKTVSPGLTATVHWQIEGDRLVRTETLTAAKPLTLRSWWVAVPATRNRVVPGREGYRFASRRGDLEVRLVHSGWPITASLMAAGNGPLGKGARRPIPLHLELRAYDIHLTPGHPMSWQLQLQELPGRRKG